jgi:hypothetical protein
VRTIINFIPWGKILKAGEIVADFWKGAKALITFGKEVEKAEKVIVDSERVLADAERAGQEAERLAAEGERAAREAEHAAQEAKASGASESSGGEPGCKSFPPGTLVLLADGSTKPIEQVHDGDAVLTTNPEIGKVEQHQVVGTDIRGDEPQRTELTVSSDGKSGTVVATDWHPVWVEEDGAWIAIADVQVGEHLHSPDGHPVVVTAVRHFVQTSSVHDLTVDSVHDFYVATEASSLLVHNCGQGGGSRIENCRSNPMESRLRTRPRRAIRIPNWGPPKAGEPVPTRRRASSTPRASRSAISTSPITDVPPITPIPISTPIRRTPRAARVNVVMRRSWCIRDG